MVQTQTVNLKFKYADPYERYKHAFKTMPKAQILLTAFCLLCLVFKLAVADAPLTDMFWTPASMGTWKWIQDWSFLGTVTQVIISFCSSIGLMLMIVSTVTTLLYYSNTSLFDLVNELKSGATDGPLGLKSVFSSLTDGKNGATVDGIIRVLLMFLPDFKRYSEMSDDSRESYGLSENASITEWGFKTLPRKLAVGILLAAAFCGVLFQIFGNIVNGGIAVLQNVEQYQISNWVNRAFAEGTPPNTYLNLTNTEKGSAQQGVANVLYSQACGAGNVISTYGKQQVMNNASKYVQANFTDSFVQKLAHGQNINDSTWGSVKYKGQYITFQPTNMSATQMYVPMSTLVPGTKVPGGVILDFNPNVNTTAVSPFSINNKNLE